MVLSDRQLLDAISRTPFVDSAEVAHILGEPHTTIHRALANLLAEGIVGRVSHGTAHLPSSQRYYLTADGIRRDGRVPRLRDSLGLRASLPRVQGVPDAAHPPDGRGSQRLPSSRLDVPRHRRAQVPGGVPPQGRASTPPSPSTTAAASA